MNGPSLEEEYLLEAGEYRAAVTRRGAALRMLRHGGDDLVDGFAQGARPDGSRGEVLAPWPNRLRDGLWHWKGQTLRLDVDAPDRGNSASHGLVRQELWQPVLREPDAVRLETLLLPRAGYPFTLRIQAEYRLDPQRGLTAWVRAENPGPAEVPVALGVHPYLLPPGGGPLDTARLRIPAERRAVADSWGIPREGTMPVAGSALDFRVATEIGGRRLNDAVTGLGRDSAGRVLVTLAGDAESSLHMWAGRSCKWLQLYTGDGLSPERRRRSIAVEPMTAPAGALASGRDLVVLESRQSLSLEWGLRLLHD